MGKEYRDEAIIARDLILKFGTPLFPFSPQPSLSQLATIHPVNATAVRISWRGSQYHSTTVRYLSYFNATGAEMSRYDTVLPPDVASTEVSLDDSVPGYQHTFTLQHIIACVNSVTTATFNFGQLTQIIQCSLVI